MFCKASNQAKETQIVGFVSTVVAISTVLFVHCLRQLQWLAV